MEPQTFTQRAKRTGKKILRIVIIFIVVSLAITFSFLYWGTYEDGVMAGKVLRVSEKGTMFKTFEGKISLGTFGAMRDVSPIAEAFDFSIEKSDKELREQLQEVALTGERVNLYFVKRYVAFPWRGDTKYFATRVERLGTVQK